MTTIFPKNVMAAALALPNADPPKRMPVARALRTAAQSAPGPGAGAGSGPGAGPGPMADMTELAADVMRRPVTAVEIVFASGKPAGHHYHALNVLGAPPTLKAAPFAWPTETTACCLYCSERIQGVPLPVIVYRDKLGRYTPAHALFCSEGPYYCNLAWIEDEFHSPEQSNAIMLTRDVMQRYFGCPDPMYRAGPRMLLAKYAHTGVGTGPGQSLAAFHGQGPGPRHQVVACHQPPLVTFGAIVECRVEEHAGSFGSGSAPASGSAPGSGSGAGAGMAFANNQVRGLRRPTVRDTPVADPKPTGKPPRILAFVAAKAREAMLEQARKAVSGAGAEPETETGPGPSLEAEPKEPESESEPVRTKKRARPAAKDKDKDKDEKDEKEEEDKTAKAKAKPKPKPKPKSKEEGEGKTGNEPKAEPEPEPKRRAEDEEEEPPAKRAKRDEAQELVPSVMLGAKKKRAGGLSRFLTTH